MERRTAWRDRVEENDPSGADSIRVRIGVPRQPCYGQQRRSAASVPRHRHLAHQRQAPKRRNRDVTRSAAGRPAPRQPGQAPRARSRPHHTVEAINQFFMLVCQIWVSAERLQIRRG